MINLEQIKQQIVLLSQRKNAAYESFHQICGALCTLEELLKTIQQESDSTIGEKKDGETHNEPEEHAS